MHLLKIKFGSDPEFFLKNSKEKIVEATKIIPPETKKQLIPWGSENINIDANGATLISDGIQAELNLKPSICRANIGNNLKQTFTELKKFCKTKKLKICLSQTITIPKKEFNEMPDYCKEFGCMPSYNIYIRKKDKTSQITVDPLKYRFRGCGGHIHIGFLKNYCFWDGWKDKIPEIIKTLDIIVGNTCVLIDRDKNIKERRKNYGKAGEYRLPKHGIEYRTLSNFWLKDYRLMSMVFQLTRIAVSIVKNKHHKKLFRLVNQKDIIKAINENDLTIAKKNFNKIKPLMEKLFNSGYSEQCFGKDLRKTFYLLIENHKKFYKTLGIDKMSDEELVNKWTHQPEGHGNGFESFLYKTKNGL